MKKGTYTKIAGNLTPTITPSAAYDLYLRGIEACKGGKLHEATFHFKTAFEAMSNLSRDLIDQLIGPIADLISSEKNNYLNLRNIISILSEINLNFKDYIIDYLIDTIIFLLDQNDEGKNDYKTISNIIQIILGLKLQSFDQLNECIITTNESHEDQNSTPLVKISKKDPALIQEHLNPLTVLVLDLIKACSDDKDFFAACNIIDIILQYNPACSNEIKTNFPEATEFFIEKNYQTAETIRRNAPDAALNYFEKILLLDPNHNGSLSGKADIYLAQGRLQEAEGLFTELLKPILNYQVLNSPKVPVYSEDDIFTYEGCVASILARAEITEAEAEAARKAEEPNEGEISSKIEKSKEILQDLEDKLLIPLQFCSLVENIDKVLSSRISILSFKLGNFIPAAKYRILHENRCKKLEINPNPCDKSLKELADLLRSIDKITKYQLPITSIMLKEIKATNEKIAAMNTYFTLQDYPERIDTFSTKVPSLKNQILTKIKYSEIDGFKKIKTEFGAQLLPGELHDEFENIKNTWPRASEKEQEMPSSFGMSVD